MLLVGCEGGAASPPSPLLWVLGANVDRLGAGTGEGGSSVSIHANRLYIVAMTRTRQGVVSFNSMPWTFVVVGERVVGVKCEAIDRDDRKG